MTEQQLQKLAVLHEKTTSGDWYYVAPLSDEEAMKPGGLPAKLIAVPSDDGNATDLLDYPSPRDLEFIAEVRNCLPELLEIARREKSLSNLIDALRKDTKEASTEVDKALCEFGYDDIRFADVRHGWLTYHRTRMALIDYEKELDDNAD